MHANTVSACTNRWLASLIAAFSSCRAAASSTVITGAVELAETGLAEIDLAEPDLGASPVPPENAVAEAAVTETGVTTVSAATVAFCCATSAFSVCAKCSVNGSSTVHIASKASSLLRL
jgi:hypothetical protein